MGHTAVKPSRTDWFRILSGNVSDLRTRLECLRNTGGLYRVFWDTGYWLIFKGILGYLCVCVFLLFWDMGHLISFFVYDMF